MEYYSALKRDVILIQHGNLKIMLSETSQTQYKYYKDYMIPFILGT
jgi:hypothetical protein